jgi:hypothetical protein
MADPPETMTSAQVADYLGYTGTWRASSANHTLRHNGITPVNPHAHILEWDAATVYATLAPENRPGLGAPGRPRPYNRGENNPNAKVTPTLATEIRARHAAGLAAAERAHKTGGDRAARRALTEARATPTTLAEDYNLSRLTIRRIINQPTTEGT